MGSVYAAHDPVIDRQVAIKLVSAQLLEGEERQDFVARFQREAQAAGRCNHPGIVAIYDFALHEGDPFLTMEYVEGVGLDQVLRRGERYTPAAAVQLILQVLEALASAHALGIVHRDIKPANILLTAGGRVKVTDFGIAWIDHSDLTQVGMVIGTPSHMSPEQCRGEAVDARSDLFSTATVLQELLSGQGPLPAGGLTQSADVRLSTPPAAAPADVVGTGLRSVLARALARRAEDRFADALAMAEALRQAIGESTPPTKPPAERAAANDQTIVRGRTPALTAESPGGGTLFAPALLSGLERRLAHHVGPLAPYLVKTALRATASGEELCDLLAQRIDRPDARQQFLAEALDAVRAGATRPPGARPESSRPETTAAIPPQERERAQRALAQRIGPIARILVQRALGQAQTSRELWELLATHLNSATERADFLRQRDAG